MNAFKQIEPDLDDKFNIKSTDFDDIWNGEGKEAERRVCNSSEISIFPKKTQEVEK